MGQVVRTMSTRDSISLKVDSSVDEKSTRLTRFPWKKQKRKRKRKHARIRHTATAKNGGRLSSFIVSRQSGVGRPFCQLEEWPATFFPLDLTWLPKVTHLSNPPCRSINANSFRPKIRFLHPTRELLSSTFSFFFLFFSSSSSFFLFFALPPWKF